MGKSDMRKVWVIRFFLAVILLSSSLLKGIGLFGNQGTYLFGIQLVSALVLVEALLGFAILRTKWQRTASVAIFGFFLTTTLVLSLIHI